MKIKDDDSIQCGMCSWIGKIEDCKEKYVYSSPEEWRMLAGREGWEYYCPKCGNFLTSYYIKMS